MNLRNSVRKVPYTKERPNGKYSKVQKNENKTAALTVEYLNDISWCSTSIDKDEEKLKIENELENIFQSIFTVEQ